MNIQTNLFAAFTLSFALLGCHHKSTHGVNAAPIGAETIAPTVSSTDPMDAATGVPTNQVLTAVFDETMDPATVTSVTFMLEDPNGGVVVPVAGTVTYDNQTATFTQMAGSNLAVNTVYVATVTTGMSDVAGNALAIDHVWSFTTSATAADITAPTVSATNPADTSVDVAINQKITAQFDESMDPASITATTFTLADTNGGTPLPVTGIVVCVDKTATFTPEPLGTLLLVNTVYTATITTGVADLAGNSLAADHVWSFTTGTTEDLTAPSVTRIRPADLAFGVSINPIIAAGFSEAMDPETINETTFTVNETGSGAAVLGTVTSLGKIALFDPASHLAANTVHTVTMTTGALDLAGNPLAFDKVWSFTTGTATNPTVVDLGTSGAFAILAKSGITDVPTSIITGDVGASPITGAAIGVTCADVTGTIYAVDAAGPLPCSVTDATLLTTAVSDMEIAYADAAGRTLPDFTELGAGEIGGLTLVHGLYKWGSDVSISTDVTLSGRPNDIWIFQIAGNLTQASAVTVHLAGGAQAKNIFWQVAGGAGVALGTVAHFEGNILALKTIALNDGVSVNGGLLSQTEVTLQGNTVTIATP